MKNKALVLILISAGLILKIRIQEFSINSLIFFWGVVLLLILINYKNHFISLLLILEMLSIRSILMIRFFANLTNSISLIFILITLRVGEAVLGLAILVKLIRWSSSEFILRGLN